VTIAEADLHEMFMTDYSVVSTDAAA